VIVKPAELTPFAPELFARLCKEAGVPDGVLTLMPGSVAAGEALVRHPKIHTCAPRACRAEHV
jgi:aldehyde dehydrogenase (NAD+)